MDVKVRLDAFVCIGYWERETVIDVGVLSVRQTHLQCPIFKLVKGKFSHSHGFWYLESGMVLEDLGSLFSHGLQDGLVPRHVGSVLM